MKDRFSSIKAQIDNEAASIAREEEKLHEAIAYLLKGYKEVADIPDIPGNSTDVGLRLAKKIAEEYAQFDVDDFHL